MPSPDSLPLRAASAIAATIGSALSSSTMKTSSAFGRKRDSNTRPRYSCVTPRWRPWPIASMTVTPTWPVASSTASITVSTRSLMTTASTLTMSGVVVEGEFRGMRPQPDDVDLVLALPVDPGADQLLAEDVVLQQEVVVRLERVERLREGARHLRDVAVQLLEEVVVRRRARVEPALDPVETRHQHRREREVRVRARVGTAELDPLRLRRLGVHRDADARRAVALRVDEVDRRLVTRHEPAVRIRRRRAEREQRRCVQQDAADVRAREGAQSGVARLVAEEGRALHPERLVAMHARPVVAEDRLRHERRRLAVPACDVLDHVLVGHHLVGHPGQRLEAQVDLALTAGRDLVVVELAGY